MQLIPNRRHRYHACGLRVVSDIALPSLLDAVGEDDRAEVEIAHAPVPETLEEPLLGSGPNWELAPARFLLRVPPVGRFLIEDRARVHYQPAQGKSPEDLAAFLTGSVMGLLLHLRGALVIHGSAVEVGGRAAIFCGASGVGKSTLAAALGRRGYPMASDDLSTLARDEHHNITLWPDGRKHKLWARAINALDLTDRQGDGVRQQIHKFHVEPSAITTAALPVGWIYELSEDRGDPQIRIERASLPDAAVLMRRNAFRAKIMWELNQKDAYFLAAAQIARTSGFFHIKRPRDFTRMDEVVDQLVAHWDCTGAGVRT